MDNHLYVQNIPPRAPRVLCQNQPHRLPEHSCLSERDLVSLNVLASVTEPAGTIGKAATVVYSLSGEYFAQWAHQPQLNNV